jgi:hypothetical protein
MYRILVMQKRSADAEQILKDAFQAAPKQFGYLTMLAMHYSNRGPHQ